MLALSPQHTYLFAISGGGDSMALANMAKQQGLNVAWAHVNHGWNEAEHQAAAFVTKQAQMYGVTLHTHTVTEPKPASNAEAKARQERYTFFAEMCKKYGYHGVVVAHTQTDVAETFLMRAGKGSGVQGLAAMQPFTVRQGLSIYRPLLSISREALRDYLRANHQAWLVDPDNQSLANQRAKIRALLPALKAAGVTVHGLAAAANALARADEALQSSTQSILPETVQLPTLLALPAEHALRQLEQLLRQHLPNQLPPRMGKRLALLARLRTQPSGHATLGGLKWRWQNGMLRVCPEQPH